MTTAPFAVMLWVGLAGSPEIPSEPAPTAPKTTPEDDADTEEAKTRFAMGSAYFQRRDFKAAIAEFQAGFALTRRNAFLLNIAICQRQMGQKELALATFRDLLEKEPGFPRRPDVERHMREIERELGIAPRANEGHDAEARRDEEQADDGVELLSTRPAGDATFRIRPAAGPEPSLTATRREDGGNGDAQASSLLTSGWFWAGTGAVVLGAVVIGLVLSADRGAHTGSIGTIDVR